MSSKEEKGNSRLSKEEKEKLVLKLLKENKMNREITHLAGVSPNFISNTIKKSEGVENQPSINNQAFKMFEEGMQPINVSIGLQIRAEETQKYHREYQNLKAEGELPKVRDILGKDLVPFVNLFREMRSVFSLERIKEALMIADNIDKAYSDLALIEMDTERKIKAVEKLALEYSKLQNDTAIAKQELADVKQEIAVIKQELETLKSIKQLLMFSIQSRAQ
jgi:hypothetical protein